MWSIQDHTRHVRKVRADWGQCLCFEWKLLSLSFPVTNKMASSCTSHRLTFLSLCFCSWMKIKVAGPDSGLVICQGAGIYTALASYDTHRICKSQRWIKLAGCTALHIYSLVHVSIGSSLKQRCFVLLNDNIYIYIYILALDGVLDPFSSLLMSYFTHQCNTTEMYPQGLARFWTHR